MHATSTADFTRANPSPLTTAAAPVFAFATRLNRLANDADAGRIRPSALNIVGEFRRRMRINGASDDDTVVLSAALAALIDDIAVETGWGARSNWRDNTIASSVMPVTTGESFYAKVASFCEAPSRSHAALEIVYVCLSLGLSGRCWQLRDADPFLDALRDKLLQRLRDGGTATNLSPEWRGADIAVEGSGKGVCSWLARLMRSRPREELDLIEGLEKRAGNASSIESPILHERFAYGLGAISKHLRSKGQSLTRLPWYVVIGAPGVGKTSALRNSGLDFPLFSLTGFTPLQGMHGTRHCDFWLTDGAMFLDTAGRYFQHDGDAGEDALEWDAFLELLKRTRGKQPVNGLIVMMSVVDLISTLADRQRHAEAVRVRLMEFQRAFPVVLPTYVVITKLDLLAGFVESFDGLDRQERAQVLGFTLPVAPDQPNSSLLDRILPAFDRLVERQRTLSVQRLRSERDIGRRGPIFDFASQFASLGRPLEDFFRLVFDKALLDRPPLPRGVYFTSALQEGVPIDPWSAVVQAETGLEVLPLKAHAGRSRAFFLHDLYREVLLREPGLVAAFGKSSRL